MTHQYLIEIGLEDMPAHVVTPSLQQFHDKTVAFLKKIISITARLTSMQHRGA